MNATFFKTLTRVFFLGSLWGPSFLFIKLCLTDLPPLSIACLRFLISSILLWSIIAIQRANIPRSPTIYKHLFVMSIFSMALPISLICLAEQHIDSAIAGIINGTVPLGTVFLAHFFLQGEQITVQRLCGVLCGLIGFLILLLPTVLDREITADSYGLIGVGCASMCYAIGMVYAKKNLHGIKGIIVPTIQLSFATLLTGIAVLIFEPTFSELSPSTTSILSLLGLSLLGTVGAFIMYYKILEMDGPVILSMTGYLLPVYAIILGAVFLNEAISVTVFMAISFILFGIFLINRK